jgi:hypothetical protein
MAPEQTARSAEAAFRDIGVYGLSVWSVAESDAAKIVRTVRSHDETTGFPNLPHGQIRTSTAGALQARGFGLEPDSPFGHYLLTIPTPPTDEDWDALQEEFGPPEPTPTG